MSTIHCNAKLSKIGSWMILGLPKITSTKLPSRGMVMVEGTINDFPLQTALEPDGRGSHWFRVDEALTKKAHIGVGDTVSLEIEPSEKWPEPNLSVDLKKALTADPEANKLWLEITPMARWDWIRWIRGTKNTDTFKKRVRVALSKLKNGDRRPCCFNRTQCTEPDVSNNGVLIEPIQAL